MRLCALPYGFRATFRLIWLPEFMVTFVRTVVPNSDTGAAEFLFSCVIQ